MKKKIILSTIGVAIAIMALSVKNLADVTGLCDSPVVGGHTGAPGEPSCTGCHGGIANTGSGKLWFNFDLANGAQSYVPGKTYTCKVRIKQNKIDKYGFVALTLRNTDNTTIGKFGLINFSTTRLYKDGNRNYVSHTPCGADFSVSDTATWTFTWQAPLTNVGSVNIYIAALAANHNHALTGDTTYTTVVSLDPATTSINEIEENIYGLNIYPNPTSKLLHFKFNKAAGKPLSVRLIDMQGHIVQIYNLMAEQSGAFQQTLNPKENFLKEGIYFLVINDGENEVTRKIVII
jgi:hypothetical protein